MILTRRHRGALEHDDTDVPGEDQASYDITTPRPGTAVATRPPFDIAQWNRENSAVVARRAEIEEKRAALGVVPKITAAHAALGAAGLATAELLADPAAGALVGAATGTVTALLWMAGRVALRRRIGQRWVSTYRRAAATGTGCVVLAPVLGVVGWPVSAAALLIGAVRCSAGWRAVHSLDTVDPLPVAVPTAVPALVVAQDESAAVRAMVMDRVTCRNGPLGGSLITTRPEQLGRGWRFVVRLPAGVYYLAVSGVDTRHAIARALERPAHQVLFEPHPDGEHLAYLTVITTDTLAEVVPYPGPQYRDGVIPIGPYPEGGTEWASWVAKDRQGAKSGAIAGDPGSGKTSIAAAIVLALRASGEWRVLFGDGDPGSGSSPELAEHADWPDAGPRGALRQLEAMEGALEARSANKGVWTRDEQTGLIVPITEPGRQRPLSTILPCPQFPGHALVFDEAHALANDRWLESHQFIERILALVRAERKYGLAVYWISQSILSTDYGGSTILQGLLHASNSFVCRIQNDNEYITIGGVTVRPSELPHDGGYAYSVHGGRKAMLRAAYRENMAEGVVLPPRIPADEVTTRGMAHVWPAGERDAVTAYREAVARAAQWSRTVEARLRGEAPESGEPTTPEPPAPGGCGVPELDGLEFPNVLRFPAPGWGTDDASPGDELKLGVNARAVLTVMLTEPGRVWRNAEIITRTGMLGPAVNKGLNELASHVLVERQGQGQWELTEIGRAVNVA